MLYRECLRVIFVVHCLRSLFCKLHLANKEALTVLCYVVKHLGSRIEHERSLGGNTRRSRVFFPTSSALPLPKCFTTEQSTDEASLFIL